jgi:trehalose 6-phosphate synthase/phosphatase
VSSSRYKTRQRERMGKIIFVSNRLPHQIIKQDGEYKSITSVSGLVSGVQAIFNKHEGIWIGWSGETQETLPLTGHLVKEWEKDNYFAVPIPSDLLITAHEGFNNRSLWALFHYFIDFIDFERSDWEAYRQYNQLFANEVLKHYENGDTVFVNDFQLMLVPELLRKALPSVKIAYFHHISFPTSDVFERLPVAKELLSGLLGANYIGFHTKGHVKAFERSVRRLGLQLGDARIDANPIGIDPAFWEQALQSPIIQAKAKFYKSCFYNKHIILATERLDYTKGIKERLKAFDYLLTTYPELQGNVTLIQVAVHSRTNVPIYQTIGQEVDTAVARLKGKYKRFDWHPIYYTNQSFTQEELAALYSISNVGCVTPLIDGLNLVSKEFTISGNNNRALILSKFAGAADELTGAYVVNPYDAEEVGEAMFTALNNPNVKELKPIVKANTIYEWANRLLEALEI